jgi:oxygen-independent coproporphyrinogen-3 oxidase
LDSQTMDRFVDMMALELKKYAQEPFFHHVPIVNVNMGGGTPMVLETRHLQKLLTTIYTHFNTEECEVISIEGDPITLQDKDKINALKEMGLTRVSFGIQTFNEKLRKKLNVESTVPDIYKAVNTLETCDIQEWGCDLLYNCPDQNVNEIRYNVDRICEMQPSVVDIYDLNISPNTVIHKMIEKNHFKSIPTNQKEIRMFKAVMETFAQNDFEQVRSVNFQPRGYPYSSKGLLFTFSMDIIAIGPSARTFLYSGHRNYRNHCSIENYIESLARDQYPIEAGNIASDEILEERDMVLFPYYLKLHKNKINYHRFKDKIHDMVVSGYIKENGDFLQLTDLGKLWAGSVQYYFHSEYEKDKMAKSMFLCLQKGKNLFNQDAMNCP